MAKTQRDLIIIFDFVILYGSEPSRARVSHFCPFYFSPSGSSFRFILLCCSYNLIRLIKVRSVLDFNNFLQNYEFKLNSAEKLDHVCVGTLGVRFIN